MSVGEILEAVRALTPEERAQVKALIDSLPSESPDEESLQHRLVAAGLIRRAEIRTDRDEIEFERPKLLHRIASSSTTPDSSRAAKSTPRRTRLGDVAFDERAAVEKVDRHH